MNNYQTGLTLRQLAHRSVPFILRLQGKKNKNDASASFNVF